MTRLAVLCPLSDEDRLPLHINQSMNRGLCVIFHCERSDAVLQRTDCERGEEKKTQQGLILSNSITFIHPISFASFFLLGGRRTS